MENTKDTKQQESPPLPAPAGSEPPVNIPRDMLRLVCQVEDTEDNRTALTACVKAIKSIPFPGAQGFSVLKLEQVRPTFMAKMIPNNQAHRQPPDETAGA